MFFKQIDNPIFSLIFFFFKFFAECFIIVRYNNMIQELKIKTFAI